MKKRERNLMKTTVVIVCIFGLLPLFPPLGLAADEGEVYAVHRAWKTAVEQADIAQVDAIWAQTDDALLLTLLGDKIQGWQKVRQEIQKAWDLVGKTKIIVSNRVITVSGDSASATMDYRWSPIPDLPLKATERYRKVDGAWKMHAQDGTGGLAPLRPNAEIRLRQQVQQTQAALLGNHPAVLKTQIAPDFTYIALNGTVYRQWEADRIESDLKKIHDLCLKVVYLTDDRATAHYLLTLVNADERDIQWVYDNNWKLTHINCAPQAPQTIQPNSKLSMTWARIKAERRW
jgi:ketosteroid isomerase-like protein